MNRLLLEIGTEELPAGYIQPALDALTSNLTRRLSAARIAHGEIQTYATPRRLAVTIADVAPRQKSVTEQITGPPERIAFDGDGNPTVPAQKFAQKVGLAVDRLSVADTEKGRYLCATIVDKGLASKTLLQKLLPEIILATPFPKTMRWSDLKIAFARPIQSVLALLGKSVISFTLGERLKSGRYAWGHMFMHHKKIKIDDADTYLDSLRQAQVIADIQARKEMVAQEIAGAAAGLGGKTLADDELLDIVTNLVELPVAVGGKFDPEFLELPGEILITSMREHQKYFAVVDDDDQLMPCFVAVNNTRTRDMALVAKGHERVLRARLSDAQFFYRSDIKQSMDHWGEKLDGVLFQAKLGSMQAKSRRIEQLGAFLAQAAAPELKSHVIRAAQLCKTDLLSQVVVEFPKLQGIMGRTYAAKSGEAPEVATAIEEHYRPIRSGGALPQTRAGALLAIADKLDTICGCFSVGLIPTGASDPYALRRQGIGIVQIMLAQGLTFSLKQAIDEGLKDFEAVDKQTTAEAIYTFLQNRISHLLVEEGVAKDVVAAVVDVSVDHIPQVWQRATALQQLKGDADFEPLAVAFKRAVNILRKSDAAALAAPDENLFVEAAEGELYKAYAKVRDQVEHFIASGDFEQALRTIATLRGPVDRFFEDVMVMDEDEALRQNRLALLQVIAAMFDRIADFSKLST